MSEDTGCNHCNSSTSSNEIPKGCGNKGHCTSGNCNKLNSFDWLSNIKNQSEEYFPFIEVRFKNDRKAFYKNTDSLSLVVGSIVAVESSPGHDLGVVALKGALAQIQLQGKKIKEDETIKKIYRIANQQDIDKWKEIRAKEYPTMLETRKIASRLGLEMKICDVEYQADGSKAIFYYTAEGRVDFRELIKELATTFKIRIEMRQIGYRQAAAKIGGIASCGRELCCSSWLTDFRTVNTIAARYQQLSINPQKLAGQCGKLKCCLNYELDSYMEAFKNFPEMTLKLQTEKGPAQCMKMDIFKNEVWYAYLTTPMAWIKLSVETANLIIEKNKKGQKITALEDFSTQNHLDEKEVSFVTALNDDNINRFKEEKNYKNRNKKRRIQNTKKESQNVVNNTEIKTTKPIKNTITKENNIYQKNNKNRGKQKFRGNPKNNKPE